MFEEGNIIYFSPFYFKNGNTPKNKYFVVLKNVGNEVIVASLPTRKDFIPTDKMIPCGCIEDPKSRINCFVFSPKTEVTECGKSFDFPTHMYGYQLDDYKISELDKIYKVEGVDFVIWGKMKPQLFSQVLECFRTSDSVKRKYTRLL